MRKLYGWNKFNSNKSQKKKKEQKMEVTMEKKVRTLYTCNSSKNDIPSNPLLMIGSKSIEKIKDHCICLSDMTRNNNEGF
jgi:hypothetical protein